MYEGNDKQSMVDMGRSGRRLYKLAAISLPEVGRSWPSQGMLSSIGTPWQAVLAQA
jgi:hypothetical protein